MEAIHRQEIITTSGELTLKNLPLEAGQQVEVVLRVRSSVKQVGLTAKDLLNSELIGLWKARTDIADSLTYAQQLRVQAQNRRRDTDDNA